MAASFSTRGNGEHGVPKNLDPAKDSHDSLTKRMISNFKLTLWPKGTELRDAVFHEDTAMGMLMTANRLIKMINESTMYKSKTAMLTCRCLIGFAPPASGKTTVISTLQRAWKKSFSRVIFDADQVITICWPELFSVIHKIHAKPSFGAKMSVADLEMATLFEMNYAMMVDLFAIYVENILRERFRVNDQWYTMQCMIIGAIPLCVPDFTCVIPQKEHLRNVTIRLKMRLGHYPPDEGTMIRDRAYATYLHIQYPGLRHFECPMEEAVCKMFINDEMVLHHRQLVNPDAVLMRHFGSSKCVRNDYPYDAEDAWAEDVNSPLHAIVRQKLQCQGIFHDRDVNGFMPIDVAIYHLVSAHIEHREWVIDEWNESVEKIEKERRSHSRVVSLVSDFVGGGMAYEPSMWSSDE